MRSVVRDGEHDWLAVWLGTPYGEGLGPICVSAGGANESADSADAHVCYTPQQALNLAKALTDAVKEVTGA